MNWTVVNKAVIITAVILGILPPFRRTSNRLLAWVLPRTEAAAAPLLAAKWDEQHPGISRDDWR